MKRRNFIKTSVTLGVGLAVPGALTSLAAQPAANLLASKFPWEREMPLREARAGHVFDAAGR
ncbi:MAG: twin-arginine translocation signal domain-containing protein [Verrucomicrobiota bacterium]|jgi:hypothetical protein